MGDPVASKSVFLCMYMKNHPDTLVAYVKHFGKVPSNVSSAQMKSIDCKGMDLSYSLESGGVDSVHVKFDPPLAGYDDVKPRLLAMKAKAQEALGMIKSPKITSFRLPADALVVLFLITGGAYFSIAPPPGTSLLSIPTNITDMIFAPARTILSMVDFQPYIRGILKFTAVIHVFEALYTWYLCRDCVEGPFTTFAYVSTTMAFGFPIWADLKKKVQEKRIESVMKVE